MVAHQALVRTPRFAGPGRQPFLAERTDQEFLPAIFDELRSADGIRKLAASAVAPQPDRTLKLYQPIHRTFYMAMSEVVCERTGFPRLDPVAIDSAGIVVRRIEAGSREKRYGWMHNANRVQGWVAFNSGDEEDTDPDLPRRRPVIRTGNAPINERLALIARSRVPAIQNGAPRFNELVFQESAGPAFAAPPDVCSDARTTVVYGLLTVASAETNELAPAPSLAEDEILADGHYPSYFRQGGSRSVPLAGTSVTADNEADLGDFLDFLKQLAFEFGFAENTPQATALRAALNRLTADLGSGNSMPAGDALSQAIETMLRRSQAAFTMPVSWPAVDGTTAAQIFLAVRGALDLRLAAIAPREGRFDDPDAFYRARMFVRVRSEDGCPPSLRWSQYTDPFRIAPWHDTNGNVPPVRVALPDITSGNAKNFKPNVAFAVPPALQALIQGNSPDDFLKNQASEKSSGLELGWICSFSLPVITLCAFIVLNIFLQLFNIIFQWLFFIKICIPFPKKK